MRVAFTSVCTCHVMLCHVMLSCLHLRMHPTANLVYKGFHCPCHVMLCHGISWLAYSASCNPNLRCPHSNRSLAIPEVVWSFPGADLDLAVQGVVGDGDSKALSALTLSVSPYTYLFVCHTSLGTSDRHPIWPIRQPLPSAYPSPGAIDPSPDQ